jgi:hypothetical protein
MKKILIVTLMVSMFGSVQAQYQEDPKSVRRVNIFDIPRTDSALFLKDMRPILGFTANNANEAVYALGDPQLYAMVVQMLSDTATQRQLAAGGFYLGISLVVDYLPDFSIYTRRQIKDMPADRQAIVEAFNGKKKYTVISQSPYVIRGIRVRRPNGDIAIVEYAPDQQGSNQTISTNVQPQNIIPNIVPNINPGTTVPNTTQGQNTNSNPMKKF